MIIIFLCVASIRSAIDLLAGQHEQRWINSGRQKRSSRAALRWLGKCCHRLLPRFAQKLDHNLARVTVQNALTEALCDGLWHNKSMRSCTYHSWSCELVM